MTTSANAPLSVQDFELLFDELKNWGRWGPDDELGTLNFLGPAEVIAACKLVTQGPVSYTHLVTVPGTLMSTRPECLPDKAVPPPRPGKNDLLGGRSRY